MDTTDPKTPQDTPDQPAVNLDLLQAETGLSLDSIASDLGIKNKAAIYKWTYPAENGGTRPRFRDIYRLLTLGATTLSLFGIDCSLPDKEKSELAEDEEFVAGVRAVVERMKREGMI